MNDEKLIECVRLNPALYNLGDPKYLDAKYKNDLWRKIASEMMLNEKDFSVCKSRWINIRDQYKKYLKNEKTVKGQAAKTKKKYKYASFLEFLNGHEDERVGYSNFSVSQDNNTSIENEPEHKEVTNEISVVDIQPHVTTNNASNDNDSSNDSKHFSKKRKTTSNVSTSNTLIEYIIENNKKRRDDKDAIHPIDAFLNGLAPTLKLLSPYNQHLAKGEIFKIVHNLELQELCQSSTSPALNLINHPTSSRLSQASDTSSSHQI